jgi:HemX protein
MNFVNTGWLYDITIILYALSVLGYFIDFLQNDRRVNRIAFWLLSIVWVLQTLFLIARMIEIGRFPLLSISEGLFFYAWVLVTLSLIINRMFRIDFFVFFTNVLGFLIMTLHLFAPVQYKSNMLSQQLISELLFIHISIALLSYGAFSLSFIFSMMYLFQYEMLKKKKWGKRLKRFGDLSMLERFTFTLNMIGVPMLLLSLILGVVWGYISMEQFEWYDTKVIGSFSVFIAYSVCLYLRVAKGFQGKTMISWNIAAFLVLLINYFLFGSLSRFHF